MVFVERLEQHLGHLEKIPFSGKFGGATGGLNAHAAAYDNIDWVSFANRWYKDAFKLERQQYDFLFNIFPRFSLSLYFLIFLV